MAASIAKKSHLSFCRQLRLHRISCGLISVRLLKSVKNYNQDLRPEHVHKNDPKRIEEEPGPWKNYTDLKHWKQEKYKRNAEKTFDMEQLNAELEKMNITLNTENNEPTPLENPYTKPPKKCILCEHKLEVNYKNPKLLSQFISSYSGRIYGRHVTGLCVHMQRRVAREIRTARRMGFISSAFKNPEYLKDPRLFDPFKKA